MIYDVPESSKNRCRSGMRAASSICCMRRPERPAAVPFGKECSVDKMSKSGPREIHVGVFGP